MSSRLQHPQITTIQPDDPALLVKLEAKPPVIGESYGGRPKHADWTLDLLERTLFEFRAAGAWDGAGVKFDYGGSWSVSCEVLASRGADAMPWGWRPSQVPPPPSVPDTLPSPATPSTSGGWPGRELLGNRMLHGVLLLVLLALAVTR